MDFHIVKLTLTVLHCMQAISLVAEGEEVTAGELGGWPLDVALYSTISLLSPPPSLSLSLSLSLISLSLSLHTELEINNVIKRSETNQLLQVRGWGKSYNFPTLILFFLRS